MTLPDAIRSFVRRIMGRIAKILNKISGGKITPNSVTIVGLLAHIPIAVLIAYKNNIVAAILLIIFGLFDSLDGELARLQKRDSPIGMLLDASTDRFKEVMLYSGAAFAIINSSRPLLAVWAVVACGASLSVSYVKAKGETAVAKSSLTTSEVNRLFQDGIMRFEVRMVVLIVGLIFNRLMIAVVFIALTASLTALQRLITITSKLKNV